MEQEQQQPKKTEANQQNRKAPAAASKNVIPNKSGTAKKSMTTTSSTTNKAAHASDNKNKNTKQVGNKATKSTIPSAGPSSKKEDIKDKDEGNSDESWEKDFDITDTK